jgi:hypothetical protein
MTDTTQPQTQQPPQAEVPILPPVSTKGVSYERGSRMLVVEIDSRVWAQPINGGNVAVQGVRRYRIPASDLPTLKAQERTDEDREYYRRAAEIFERKLQQQIDDDGDAQEHKRAGDFEAYEKRVRELRRETHLSPEGCMNSEFRRSLPPFESVRVVAEELNPQDAEREAEETQRVEQERQLRREDQVATAEAVARAVAAALAAEKRK